MLFSLARMYRYKSVENVATVEKIVKEVQGVNPSFQESDIRGIYHIAFNFNSLLFIYGTCTCTAAAYRYYRTRAQQESLVKRGKDIERKQLRRKHERIVRVSPLQLYNNSVIITQMYMH